MTPSLILVARELVRRHSEIGEAPTATISRLLSDEDADAVFSDLQELYCDDATEQCSACGSYYNPTGPNAILDGRQVCHKCRRT